MREYGAELLTKVNRVIIPGLKFKVDLYNRTYRKRIESVEKATNKKPIRTDIKKDHSNSWNR